MNQAHHFAVGFLLTLVSMSASLLVTESAAAPVKVRDVQLIVPAHWKQEQPTSNLRAAQFRIPKAEGDREDAELAVFNFAGGGGIDANIQRWVEQFQPAGRTVRVVSGQSAQGIYHLVDVAGTYNQPDGPPFLRKTKPVPDSRAVSVILQVEQKGLYFLKLVGPRKTVAENLAAFRTSFGAASADEEKEYKSAP